MKIKCIIMIFVMLVFLSACGKKEIYTFTEENNAVTITGLTEYGKEQTILNIPSKINGKIVEKIDRKAFNENTKIIEVNVPKEVKLIGAGAFMGCSNIEKVHVEGDIVIENGSFLSVLSIVPPVDLT